MKGMSAWIWLMTSVILGLLILTVGAKLILDSAASREKTIVIEQYGNIANKIKRICTRGGVGEIYHDQIALTPSAKAIYASNFSNEPAPDRVPIYITNKESSTGNFICLQFFGESKSRCEQMSCNVTFTYIGTPSLKSTLQNLISGLTGQSNVNKFEFLMNKTDYDRVVVIAEPFIGQQKPTISVTHTTTPTTYSTTTTYDVPTLS